MFSPQNKFMVMKVLIAPDKFKDALDAKQVCKAIAEGIHSFDNAINTVQFPMADGGNGTAALLTWHNKGRMVKTEVVDPIGRPAEASYGLSGDQKTAYIEMATASGIELLKIEERNPRKTHTKGTGMLIRHAINQGAKTIILGIGGSATNDAGIGMAHELGYRFLNKDEEEVEPVGENLGIIKQVRKTEKTQQLRDIKVIVACDVNNPLFGRNGAACVYAPQKGANEKDIAFLDEGLKNIGRVFEQFYSKDVSLEPGAGAAGGLGAGCTVFLNASLKPGITLFMEATEFEEAMRGVDLIITGEGKLDNQSLQGKVIDGICRKAQEKNIPVAALCGSLNLNTEALKASRLIYAASILPGPKLLKEAIEETSPALKMAASQLISLYCAGKSSG